MRKRLLQAQVFVLMLIASFFNVELKWRQFKMTMIIYPAQFFDWVSDKTSFFVRTPWFTLFLIIAGMLGATNSSAQITAGSASYGTFNNSNSATISYTTANTANRILMVGVAAQQPNGSVTSVTYNGIGLTKLGNLSNSSQSRIEIWFLKAPPAGTHNVVVTNSQNDNGVIGVMSFSGVDQTTPFGIITTAQGSSTTASVTVASANGELVYSVVGFNNGATNLTPGSGQTEYWDQTVNSSIAGSGSTKTGAASVSVQWTSTSASWTIGAVSLKPYTGLNSIIKSIASSSDDAEEEGPDGVNLGPGGMYLNSSDLEIVNDLVAPSSGAQIIGLRFTGLNIPSGATVTNAYLTFGAIAADSPNTNNGTTNLTIRAQAADNPTTFTSTAFNVSNRATTSSLVEWSVPAWTTGVSYNSPDLTNLVQEVVDRPGWAVGNSMVFIITGTGSRSADSYDGNSSNAPKLVITYAAPAPGGVSGASLWLKADAGTGTTTNGGLVTTWQDQSGSGYSATTTVNTGWTNPGVNPPVFRNGTSALGLNFNPSVDFTGDKSLDGVGGLSTKQLFVVFKNPVSGRTIIGLDDVDGGGGGAQSVFWYWSGVLQYLARNTSGNNYFLSQVNHSMPAASPVIFDGQHVTNTTGNVLFNGGGVSSLANTGTAPTPFTGAYRLNKTSDNLYPANGQIAEVISFNANLSTVDRQKVTSYLGLKYGVTLSHNYLNSFGMTIYNVATLGNNVAGIGRDDASALHQKQSRSMNPGLQVVIGNGGTIAADNESNTNDLTTDLSSLVWGDDAGSVAAWTATGAPSGNQILSRKWRVQETGAVETVIVQVADNSGINGLPNEGSNPVFLVVDNDANFSSGATLIPMTLNGTNWEAEVDFTNGQYFTFGQGCIFSLTGTQTNVTPCFGNANGAINLSPSGGVAPYTFTWSDIGAVGNLQNRTGLAAGEYKVVVQDAAGCIATGYFIITQPTAINVSALVTNATSSSASNGAIDLTVTNGSAPYTYSWSANGGGIVPAGQVSNQDLTGLTAGTYKVTVTDAGSCTTTATYVVQSFVYKQLYLTDPAQALDRIDPVATADGTTATVTIGAVGSVPYAPGHDVAVWSPTATPSANVWNGSSFGTTFSAISQSSRWRIMQGASSPTRDENIVIGVEKGGAISGELWNGSTFDKTNMTSLANVTETFWWSCDVAYEQQSGHALLVWSGGNTYANQVRYQVWNGTSWSAPANISAYTGGEPKQMKLAANPNSDEMILVVNDASEVDYALVWNGSSWGNQVQLSTSTTEDRTDIYCAYEQQSGQGLVVYGKGDALVRYRTWNGSVWSGENSLSPPAGVSGYARWTVMDSDRNSDRIILGVQSNDPDGWACIWNGSSWGTPILLTESNLVLDHSTSPNVAVGFEQSSGDALVTYGRSGQNVFFYRTKTSAGSWSAEQTGTNVGNNTNSMRLYADPTSNSLMLVLQDDGSDLNYIPWNGSAWGSNTVLETSSGETKNQPFLFMWSAISNFSSGAATTTFTQNPALCSPLTMPAGATVSVTNYIVPSGAFPANPNVTATLRYGSTIFATLTNPTYNSTTKLLTWTGTLASEVTAPAGEAISLTITNSETTSFVIEYDSQTKPSKVNLPVTSYIDITSFAVYNAAYPGGSIISNAVGGATVYPRVVVTDPFGSSDITNINVVVNPSGSPIAINSSSVVTCGLRYDYAWSTPFSSGTFNLTATAKEGYENTVTDVQPISFDLCTPTIGTPVFSAGATSTRCQGAGSVTYTATATSSTGITYSLDAASSAAGNTISSVTGAVTFTAGWSGASTITATATGCGGPKTATHVVTVTPIVGTPIFNIGASSTRCQGAGTVTYTATATNTTGITYSLDAASLSAGNSINASMGAVTYTAGWTGATTITASAAGCNGPKTAIHTVTHTPSVTTPVFALGATSTRCQGGNSVTYSASASNTTGITYSLDAASVAAGNFINASTGVVTYASAWSGTSVIIASAAGCSGPKTATHTVTITPNGTLTFALGPTSSRPAGNGNVTYSANANNGGSITYSLDATSLAGGLTINSNTGMVNYPPSWIGTATITASVSGCAGTLTAAHTAETNNVYKQLYLSDPSQALDRVDPVATADATTASTLPISAAPAGVAVDNITTNSSANPGSTTFSVSHTTGSGLNRLMLVGISQKNKLVNSVTYGGVPMTLVGEEISNGNARMHLYMLLNPTPGTADVVVNLSANPDKGIVVSATTFTGVNQTTPLGIFNSATANSNSPTVTVSSATGELVFDVMTMRQQTITVGAGQTQRWNVNAGGEIYGGAGSTKPGAASITMSWTPSGSKEWAIGAVSIKPAPAVTSTIFTQNPALCSPLTIKTGQPLSVSCYVNIVSGSMPASPNISAVLKYGASNIITFGNPAYSGGILTWSGSLLSDVTVPAGEAITLEITTAQPGVVFNIQYDSQTKPSKINLPVSTIIDITSYAVYSAPFPGGSIVTSAVAGTTVYPRAVVTDPFGFNDITGLSIAISPSVGTVAGTSVATAGCTRTYQYNWNTTGLGGTYSLPATAKEGYENAVTDLQALTFDICSPSIGTPVFAAGTSSTRCRGAGTVTYTATSTSSTGMTYSLDAASLAAGNTINSSTGAVTYLVGWSGTSVITATASGCGGPKTATHTVTITPYVGTPVFASGGNSIRCQGAGTVTYSATATNTTGITYSLDAASISGGNSINSSTGAVTYAAGWSGTTTITASAAGCNGPATATHTVQITPVVGTPVFGLGASSTRCGTSGTYTATAANATSITYSLGAPSLAAGCTINPLTGEVTFAEGWTGTSTITATASGCNSTATANHTVTISTSCPPVAVDDAASGAGGAPLTINVLANDTDVNNNINPNSLSVVTQPSNGTAVVSNGNIVYLPNGTFEGVDQFTYQICDLTSPTPLCATATVIVTIDPTIIDACSDAVKQQIYYLPYPEQDARLALIASTGASWLPIPSNNIRTIVSIKVPYPGMTMVWDHWEDGYESNPDNPVQSTTLVWGDNNPYNGIAPGYPDDVLPSGAAIVLDNTIPANPRVSSNIFYDGKDKIISSGAITVTQVSGEPSIIFVQCMKTNVTPVQYFGESFTIPVGQNFNSQDFAYTALFIRASENNTTLNIDKDNNGTFETTTTLNEGQSYFVNGGVLSGAIVTSSAPVGVDLHFGGLDGYSSREAPIFPATWYADTYYTPVPTTQSPDSAVVMLYNSLNRSIDINWNHGTSASGTINLPAKTVKRFPLRISSNEAYKFVNPTGESFTAIEIVDSYTPGGGGNSGSTYDWAFNLISEERLTNFAAIAWAPGSINGTANGNPVWVTPAANTTIYVKYDGDVLNGGNISPCGLRYDESHNLDALRYKKLLDSDNDQSGLAVYTCDGTKIAAVYGEDPSLSGTASPYWDVGSTIQPFCGEKLILANDDRAYTLVDQPVTIPVLNNDKGFLAAIDPNTLSTLGYRQPSNGTVSVNSNGTLLYIPNAGFVGSDTLEYGICSTPGSPLNVVCDRAYVIVTIADCPAPAKLNLISGQIFLDKNKDGVKNEDGTGMPGKVYLYADGNCNGVINTGELVDSVTVDNSGYYQFLRYPEKMVSDDFSGAGGTSSCASGSDGSASWATNWLDAGDVSVGYCVSPALSEGNTDVEIKLDGAFGYALRLDDANKSATRTVNLSGATYAFLSFSYRRANNNLTSGENIFVQVSTNGTSFTTIYTIAGDGSSDAGYVPIYNQNISAFASATTYIRFLTNGNVDEGDFVFIDDVTIRFLKYPQCYITKIDPASIPADYSLTTVGQHAMTAANSGICLAGYNFGLAKGSTTISGTLYNDPNGLSDGLVNGTAFGNPSGAAVYAYLVDATNKIRFKTTVNSGNGTFSFPQADVNSTFTLMVSTSNLALYTIAPGSATFPAKWASAGEAYGTNNGAGTGNEAGTPNSIITVITGSSAVTGIRIGIQQVNAGPDRFVCQSGSTTMAATSTPGTWTAQTGNPGTATISTPSSPTTTITNFSNSGEYFFIWTNNGVSDTAKVTVARDPAITAEPVGFTECVGGSMAVSVTATGGTPPLSYQWQSSADSISFNNIPGATLSSYTPPSATSGITYYRVNIMAGSSGCGNLTSAVAKAIILSDPVILVQPAGFNECLGDAESLTVTAAGGVPPLTYQWQSSTDNVTFSNISGANGTSYVPSSSVPGTSYFKVIISSGGNGCGSAVSGSATVTVNNPPVANLGADTTICPGTYATLNVSVSSGTAPFSYAWDNGLGSGPSKSVSPYSTTTYSVTVTDSKGCTSTDQIVVTVGLCAEVCDNGLDDDGDGLTDCADPDCGTPAISNATKSNPTNCPALNNGQITITGTGSNLQYSVDGGVTYQVSNVFTGLSAGNYYVRIRNSVSGCFQDYASNPVVLISMTCTEICNNGIDDDGDGLADCLDTDCVPVPYAGSDVNICSGASHNLSASATGGVPPYTYIWDNGLGAGQNKTVSPVSATTYHVTVTSASGCTSVDSLIVSVVLCPEDCTDGIDNDGDGLVDCDDPDCQTTGMPQLMWDSYSVCPGTAFQEQVIFNDNNLQNAAFSIATQPNNGNVSINNNGVFTYSPYNSACVNDRFVYRVCNQMTGCCDTASVFLVLHDTIPPSLVNVPPDITINCEDIVPAPPFVYGLDSCPGIYLSFEETSSLANSGACQSYTITRTWQATDLCGNTGVSSQVITVQDVTPPELFRVYTLANGKKVVAGISKRNTNLWKYVKFPVNFSVKPLVFSQVITENEADAVTIRLRNISTEGFELRLQEQESSNGIHAGEEVAWMAIEPGALNDATKLQAGLITNVTHVAKLQNFSLPFASTPALVTTMQTFKDSNPASMRISSLNLNSVQVLAEEERSADAEMTHNNEDAAYLAVKPGNIYDTENSFVAEAGVVTLTSGWTTINLNRKYNKPVVIFGGLPADGIPATIRVKNLTGSNFQVRIQNWDYLSSTHGNLVASYLVVEGSVPAVTGYYCDPNRPQLTPGVNLFATDNCDGQVTLDDSEYFTEGANGLVVEYIWTATDDCGNSMQVFREDTCSVVIVKIKALLNGAFIGSGNTGLMRDDLRTNGLIPYTEPYSQLTGFTHKGQGGGESITQDMLQVTGPDAIVDWVFVEIRDSLDSKKVLATRSALLQRDGDVIMADGSPFIIVSELVEGNYYVTIRHRNHLGVMTGGKVFLSSAAPVVDFRSSNVTVNGGLEGGKMMIDGNRALWAGDMNGDRRVLFQGPNNDIFGLFSHVLADDLNIDFLANFISTGYHRTDYNLDGKVIYQGPNNDRSLLLYQTVLSHPGNVSNLANFIVLEKMP
jgi:hypothetical protein